MKTIFTPIIIFDIQAFAEPVIQNPDMGSYGVSQMNKTTSTELSGEIKTFYDTNLLRNATPKLVFNEFGQKQTLPKGNGFTVEWRRFKTLPKALTPLVEGVIPTGSKLKMSTISVKCEQYGDYVSITDKLEFGAIDPIIGEATNELGAAAGGTMDTLTRDVVCAGTVIGYPTGITTQAALTKASKITSTDVNKMATWLKKNNAPLINGNYICILHPSVGEDLRESEGWVEAHKYASPEQIYSGEIGMLHNVRFIESTEAKIERGDDLSKTARDLTVKTASSSASPDVTVNETLEAGKLVGRFVILDDKRYKVLTNTTDKITLNAAVTASQGAKIYPGEGGAGGCAVYDCIFFGQGAWGVVEPNGMSLETIIHSKDEIGGPLNQFSTVGYKLMHAARILYPERMINFICGSSYSDLDEAN